MRGWTCEIKPKLNLPKKCTGKLFFTPLFTRLRYSFLVHAIKAYTRRGGIAPVTLNLGARLRWMVNFMPWVGSIAGVPQPVFEPGPYSRKASLSTNYVTPAPLYIWRYLYSYWPWMSRHLDIWRNWLDPLALIINIRRELPHHTSSRYQVAKQEAISGNTLPYLATGTMHSPVAWIIEKSAELCNFRLAFYNKPVLYTQKITSIFGRASNLYLCLYNQLFALFHYLFKFLTT